jgi:transposase-like protein
VALRSSSTDGRPVSSKFDHDRITALSTRPIFLCKQCRTSFSVTSGTIFTGSKKSAKDLILAACIFVGGAKGVSGLQLARYMGCQYKSSFILAHKMREVS